MNRLALALALARGDAPPPQSAPDLQKGGGGAWVAIPGDEHGGEQKLLNDRFIRRWPSADKAKEAATRYTKLATQAMIAQDANEAAGLSAGPISGASWRYRELARYAEEFQALVEKGLTGDDDLFKSQAPRDPPRPTLAKGFNGFDGGDRRGVRQDAFANLAEPAVRSGSDTMLKGIGAGFDDRWNEGLGFGGQG